MPLLVDLSDQSERHRADDGALGGHTGVDHVDGELHVLGLCPEAVEHDAEHAEAAGKAANLKGNGYGGYGLRFATFTAKDVQTRRYLLAIRLPRISYRISFYKMRSGGNGGNCVLGTHSRKNNFFYRRNCQIRLFT